MAVALILTSVTMFSLWAVMGSPMAKEKAAEQKAEEFKKWFESKVIEGARSERSFRIHLPAASHVGVLHIIWGDTLDKEYFEGDGDIFFSNYAQKSATISFMPRWFRMEKGFTVKLTRAGKLNEVGFKFLIVSPEALVRLSNTPPGKD